jgi:nitrogen fixation NifU-like protein
MWENRAITVEVSNPACGDILRLSVRFEDGRAAEVRVNKVQGCTSSIAAGSALTEWIAGKTGGELAAFDPALIDDAVGRACRRRRSMRRYFVGMEGGLW